MMLQKSNNEAINLKKKWKGSYFIYNKLLNRFYKLKDYKGNILKPPVNGEILKRYYDRQNSIIEVCFDW